MLHRAPPRALVQGQRRSHPSRRGRDRRRRELPDGRPHDHDEHPRRHRLRGRRCACWIRRSTAARTAGAIPDAITVPRADHLEAPRRRRQRRDPRPPAVHRGRAPRTPRGTLRRRGRGRRRAADHRHRLDRRPRVGRPGRRRPGHRRPGHPSAPRTRSCRSRAHGSASDSRPATTPSAATETLTAFLRDAAPWGVEVIGRPAGRSTPGRATSSTPSAPALLAARAALREAYGADVIETGSGGSIPLVPMLDRDVPRHRRAAAGRATDERSNTHSVNEKRGPRRARAHGPRRGAPHPEARGAQA